MKKLLLILVLVSLTYAGWRDSIVVNWNGYGDTADISGTLTDGTKKYTRPFPLTDGEDIRLLCKANDTAETGFANDSINFEYGYQTGNQCLDSAGNLDTCWDDHIVIDTMVVDSFGTSNNGYCSSDGSLTRYWGGADTTNVTNFAIQSRWFVPEWDCLIRYWVNSLGDPNKDGAGLDIEFELKRRKYSQVKD